MEPKRKEYWFVVTDSGDPGVGVPDLYEEVLVVATDYGDSGMNEAFVAGIKTALKEIYDTTTVATKQEYEDEMAKINKFYEEEGKKMDAAEGAN
jgi:hypothetical protein